MAQVTRDVLMVRPRAFGSNSETAISNAFQQASHESPDRLQRMAAAEFQRMVETLRAAGVHVLVGDDTASPVKPDAVFPNNWVSFHDNGDVILYPMQAESRRAERRPELCKRLARDGGFHIERIVDLSWLEERGTYLEGTGSLVIDRLNNVAYAAWSVRTHPAALSEFARRTGIHVVAFESRDEARRPIYHTNVILSLGQRCAVLCSEAIVDQDRDRVLRCIAGTGRSIIEISLKQARQFAGNVLELGTSGHTTRMIMSSTAQLAFMPDQLEQLSTFAQPLAVSIPTIERIGGGSVRCMLAEIFLPRVVVNESWKTTVMR